MSFIYLASPFSHPDERVRLKRYRIVMREAARFLKAGTWVYSPIVHCYQMAIEHDLPTDAKFWEGYSFVMLDTARELWVLKMDGWRESVGVAAEIAHARQHGKPITFIPMS